MPLLELEAMQSVYELLRGLDPSARRRVLKWVKAALDETPQSAPDTDVPSTATEPPAAESSPAAEPPAPAEDAAAEEEAPTVDGGTAEPEAAPRQRRRRAAPTKAAPARPARRATARSTDTAEPETPNRRGTRPPADEIMRIYEEAGGKLTDVARHYGKSYATIQGWASALRSQGYRIGRSRRS